MVGLGEFLPARSPDLDAQDNAGQIENDRLREKEDLKGTT